MLTRELSREAPADADVPKVIDDPAEDVPTRLLQLGRLIGDVLDLILFLTLGGVDAHDIAHLFT